MVEDIAIMMTSLVHEMQRHCLKLIEASGAEEDSGYRVRLLFLFRPFSM